MKTTQHTTTNLIVKVSAGCLWLLGLLFVAVGGTFIIWLVRIETEHYPIKEIKEIVLNEPRDEDPDPIFSVDM